MYVDVKLLVCRACMVPTSAKPLWLLSGKDKNQTFKKFSGIECGPNDMICGDCYEKVEFGSKFRDEILLFDEHYFRGLQPQLRPSMKREVNNEMKNYKQQKETPVKTEKKQKQFQCQICKKFYSRKDNLKLHFDSIHVKSKKNHLFCDKCDYSNVFKGNLRKHIIRKHNGAPASGTSSD